VANELEPDYSYGSASGRTGSENFTWMTDNSVGFRWTERLGTYTGFRFSGSRFDTNANAENNNDRTTIEGYEQFRYQLSPQTVLTSEYRYAQTDGSDKASDSTDQYFLVGVDHRFSPNTIGIFKTGAQLRDVDKGDGGLGPYLEIALQSQINQQFRLAAYTRYGAEVNGTVIDIDKSTNSHNYDYDSLLAGGDFIFSNYMDGRDVEPVKTAIPGDPDRYETNLNGYVGMSYKLTDYLFGNFYYTYTQTFTDISDEREYDRNRITLGLSAEF
jgi:hypothetical protein